MDLMDLLVVDVLPRTRLGSGSRRDWRLASAVGDGCRRPLLYCGGRPERLLDGGVGVEVVVPAKDRPHRTLPRRSLDHPLASRDSDSAAPGPEVVGSGRQRRRRPGRGVRDLDVFFGVAPAG